MPIDVDLIKVLASDTRRDILRLLGERRHTLSELAEALNLKKATILEHLEKLTAADLIRRIDDGERIWIYYELTRRGNRLVHPQRTTRFYLIMAGSVAAVLILGAIVAAMMANGPLGTSEDSAASPQGSQTRAELADDVRASAPLVVYRGFDDNVPIVLESAAPPGSTLLVAGRELAVQDDRAVLGAEDVDALPEGRHALSLRTDAGDLPLRSELDVRTPPIALAPLAVAEDETTQLSLSLGAPGLPAPTNLTVLLDGKPIQLSASGRENVFAVTPADAGVIDVRVGRLAQLDVRVLAQMRATATDDNGTLVLDVTDADGPLAGARATLGSDELGVTNATGTLRAPWPASGERALRLAAADGRVVERAILVGEGTFEDAPARFLLSAYSDPGAQTLAALVDVTNGGVANDTVTLVARLDGTAIASARVDVVAGSRSETRLVANVPLTAPVTIEAYGTRASSVAIRARSLDQDFEADGSAGATAPAYAPEPAAPAPAGDNASVRAETMKASYAQLTSLGRPPDATFVLYPMAPPTGATAHDASSMGEPQVPFVSPGLLVLSLAVVALLAARRRK